MVELQERRLGEVFGVARGLPLTYVDRTYVDETFVANLTRDKHVVVFGGSKQGKTCLRKRCLVESDCIVVQCTATTTRDDIYEMILKNAGATVSVTQTKSISGGYKINVKVEAKSKIPFVIEGGGATSGEYQKNSDDKTTTVELELDPSDANDVIRVLKASGFQRYIVIEDFHYLTEDVQREVAIDLKAFHEQSGLVFIIVGVWRESNRLVLYNGDLAGRLIPIDADRWDPGDLAKVIYIGEGLLNIRFPDEVRNELLELSQSNVGLLQESCYRLCESAGVLKTQLIEKTIGTVEQVRRVVRGIADEHAVRYHNFLQQFVEGLQKTELEMYRWIAYALVTSEPDDLKRGLRLKEIFRLLNEVHPTHKGKLLLNNVAQALAKVGKVQNKNRVQPIILDYDGNEYTLRVVDSGFILYIASRDYEELREAIGVDIPPPASTSLA